MFSSKKPMAHQKGTRQLLTSTAGPWLDVFLSLPKDHMYTLPRFFPPAALISSTMPTLIVWVAALERSRCLRFP